MSDCPFCERLEKRLYLEVENESSASFPDEFPVSDGHTLVVPKDHVGRIEDLGAQSWKELFELVRQVACDVSALPGVDGVNIGVNSGEAAGQTINHVHVHVIPRRAGDVPDPRGGIRWVIPGQADYWSSQ